MLDTIISFLAPHSCVSCNRIGFLLCDSCRTDVIEARAEICIGCGEPSTEGLCHSCAPEWPVERALLFDERTDIIKTLIDEFKYNHKRSAAGDLARLARHVLPYSTDAVLVPVPTITKHIRKRGYDHMALLARYAARYSKLRYAPVLTRSNETVQHGASKRVRIEQAEHAFTVSTPVDPQRLYIVFDDITTTGASLKAAARTLRDAGVQQVWAAALARQPLEEPLLK